MSDPVDLKLNAIAKVVIAWRQEMDKLDEISQNYPTDLTTIQLVTINKHIREIEDILYA